MSEDKKHLTFEDIKEVYKKILDIYPFLTLQEKKIFQSKTKKIIKDESLFKKDRVDYLNKLLGFLKNPHAIVVIRKNKPKTEKARLFQEYEIKNNILYIRIYTWSASDQGEAERMGKELIQICLKNKDNYGGIILDVRGNDGGSSLGAYNLLSIFFKKDFISGYLYRRENNKLIKKSRVITHNPESYIDAPIVILIDEKCFSANELFISAFKIGKRAVLMGQTTKGGSANPFVLNYQVGRQKIIVKIPTWRYFLKGEKKPLEETKIKPDIVYKKDDIVEYSKLYIKNMISKQSSDHCPIEMEIDLN